MITGSDFILGFLLFDNRLKLIKRSAAYSYYRSPDHPIINFSEPRLPANKCGELKDFTDCFLKLEVRNLKLE
jgi:hypothetical protein